MSPAVSQVVCLIALHFVSRLVVLLNVFLRKNRILSNWIFKKAKRRLPWLGLIKITPKIKGGQPGRKGNKKPVMPKVIMITPNIISSRRLAFLSIFSNH